VESGLPGAPVQSKLADGNRAANVDRGCSGGHFHSGKFLAEITAIPFITSNAIKLVTNDSRDKVRRPVKASATNVPRLKRMNHCFLLTSSCSFFICYHKPSAVLDNVAALPAVFKRSYLRYYSAEAFSILLATLTPPSPFT
jgi:hypothetical protein